MSIDPIKDHYDHIDDLISQLDNPKLSKAQMIILGSKITTLKNTVPYPLKVNCSECYHKWTVAYLPMVLSNLGDLLKGTHCRVCGADCTKIKTFNEKKEN